MENENSLCLKCQRQKTWFDFIYTKEWHLFINFVKVVGVITFIVLIYLLITEIEAIKFLAYNPCDYCMNKTGANCFLPPKL